MDFIANGSLDEVLHLVPPLLRNADTSLQTATALLDRIREEVGWNPYPDQTSQSNGAALVAQRTEADCVAHIMRVISMHAVPSDDITEQTVGLLAMIDDEESKKSIIAILPSLVSKCYSIHELNTESNEMNGSASIDNDDDVDGGVQGNALLRCVIEAFKEILNDDSSFLVPVIGALADLPLSGKMRREAYDLTRASLRIVDETDIATVVRALIRMSTDPQNFTKEQMRTKRHAKDSRMDVINCIRKECSMMPSDIDIVLINVIREASQVDNKFAQAYIAAIAKSSYVVKSRRRQISQNFITRLDVFVLLTGWSVAHLRSLVKDVLCKAVFTSSSPCYSTRNSVYEGAGKDGSLMLLLASAVERVSGSRDWARYADALVQVGQYLLAVSANRLHGHRIVLHNHANTSSLCNNYANAIAAKSEKYLRETGGVSLFGDRYMVYDALQQCQLLMQNIFQKLPETRLSIVISLLATCSGGNVTSRLVSADECVTTPATSFAAIASAQILLALSSNSTTSNMLCKFSHLLEEWWAESSFHISAEAIFDLGYAHDMDAPNALSGGVMNGVARCIANVCKHNTTLLRTYFILIQKQILCSDKVEARDLGASSGDSGSVQSRQIGNLLNVSSQIKRAGLVLASNILTVCPLKDGDALNIVRWGMSIMPHGNMKTSRSAQANALYIRPYIASLFHSLNWKEHIPGVDRALSFLYASLDQSRLVEGSMHKFLNPNRMPKPCVDKRFIFGGKGSMLANKNPLKLDVASCITCACQNLADAAHGHRETLKNVTMLWKTFLSCSRIKSAHLRKSGFQDDDMILNAVYEMPVVRPLTYRKFNKRFWTDSVDLGQEGMAVSLVKKDVPFYLFYLVSSTEFDNMLALGWSSLFASSLAIVSANETYSKTSAKSGKQENDDTSRKALMASVQNIFFLSERAQAISIALQCRVAKLSSRNSHKLQSNKRQKRDFATSKTNNGEGNDMEKTPAQHCQLEDCTEIFRNALRIDTPVLNFDVLISVICGCLSTTTTPKSEKYEFTQQEAEFQTVTLENILAALYVASMPQDNMFGQLGREFISAEKSNVELHRNICFSNDHDDVATSSANSRHSTDPEDSYDEKMRSLTKSGVLAKLVGQTRKLLTELTMGKITSKNMQQIKKVPKAKAPRRVSLVPVGKNLEGSEASPNNVEAMPPILGDRNQSESSAKNNKASVSTLIKLLTIHYHVIALVNWFLNARFKKFGGCDKLAEDIIIELADGATIKMGRNEGICVDERVQMSVSECLESLYTYFTLQWNSITESRLALAAASVLVSITAGRRKAKDCGRLCYNALHTVYPLDVEIERDRAALRKYFISHFPSSVDLDVAQVNALWRVQYARVQPLSTFTALKSALVSGVLSIPHNDAWARLLSLPYYCGQRSDISRNSMIDCSMQTISDLLICLPFLLANGTLVGCLDQLVCALEAFVKESGRKPSKKHLKKNRKQNEYLQSDALKPLSRHTFSMFHEIIFYISIVALESARPSLPHGQIGTGASNLMQAHDPYLESRRAICILSRLFRIHRFCFCGSVLAQDARNKILRNLIRESGNVLNTLQSHIQRIIAWRAKAGRKRGKQVNVITKDGRESDKNVEMDGCFSVDTMSPVLSQSMVLAADIHILCTQVRSYANEAEKKSSALGRNDTERGQPRKEKHEKVYKNVLPNLASLPRVLLRLHSFDTYFQDAIATYHLQSSSLQKVVFRVAEYLKSSDKAQVKDVDCESDNEEPIKSKDALARGVCLVMPVDPSLPKWIGEPIERMQRLIYTDDVDIDDVVDLEKDRGFLDLNDDKEDSRLASTAFEFETAIDIQSSDEDNYGSDSSSYDVYKQQERGSSRRKSDRDSDYATEEESSEDTGDKTEGTNSNSEVEIDTEEDEDLDDFTLQFSQHRR